MEVPEDASKINTETDISETMGNILSTSQENSQSDQQTNDKRDDLNDTTEEVMKPSNVFNQQTTTQETKPKDDVDEYTKNLSAQDINLIIMGKSTTDDSQSTVTDDLWLQSSQELKNVRVDTDEDFEVIVKSLETAIDATDSYDTIATTSKTNSDGTDDLIKCLGLDNLNNPIENPILENVKKIECRIDNVEQPSSSNDAPHRFVEHSEDTNESEDFTLRLEEEDENTQEMKRITSSISEEVVTSSTPDLQTENVRNIGDKTEEKVEEMVESVIGNKNVETEKINDAINPAENVTGEADVTCGSEDVKIETDDAKTETENTSGVKIDNDAGDVEKTTGTDEILKTNESVTETENEAVNISESISEAEIKNILGIEDKDTSRVGLEKTSIECESVTEIESSGTSTITTETDCLISTQSEPTNITDSSNATITVSNSSTDADSVNISEISTELAPKTECESKNETENPSNESITESESLTEISTRSISENENPSPENKKVSIPENENVSVLENENITISSIVQISKNENVTITESITETKITTIPESKNVSSDDKIIEKFDTIENIEARNETIEASMVDDVIKNPEIENEEKTNKIEMESTAENPIRDEKVHKSSEQDEMESTKIPDKIEDTKDDKSSIPSSEPAIKIVNKEPADSENKSEEIHSKPSDLDPSIKSEFQENSSPQKIKLIRDKPKSKPKKGCAQKTESVIKSDVPPQKSEPSQPLEVAQKIDTPSQKADLCLPNEEKPENIEPPPQKIELPPQTPEISEEPKLEVKDPKKEETTEVVETKTPQKLKLTRNYRVPKSAKKIVKITPQVGQEEKKKEGLEKIDVKTEKEIKMAERKIMEVEVEKLVSEMEANVKGVKEIKEDVKCVEEVEGIKIVEEFEKIDAVVIEKNMEEKEVVKEMEVKEVEEAIEAVKEMEVKEVVEEMEAKEVVKEMEIEEKEVVKKIEEIIKDDKKEAEKKMEVIPQVKEVTSEDKEEKVTENKIITENPQIAESSTLITDQKSMTIDMTDKSVVTTEADMKLLTVTAPDNKLVIETNKSDVEIKADVVSVVVSDPDEKSVAVSKSDEISEPINETDEKSVSVKGSDEKLISVCETDKKSVTLSESEVINESDKISTTVIEFGLKSLNEIEVDKKSVVVTDAKSVSKPSVSIPEVELFPKIGLGSEKGKELKVLVEKDDVKTVPFKSKTCPKIQPKPAQKTDDVEENIEDMLPKTIISRTIQEPEPEPVKEIPVKIPKKRGRKKKVVLPPSEIQEVDTTPTVMMTRRGSTRLSTRLEESQKPSVSIQHVPAKRPADVEINKLTKKIRLNETETIVIDEDEDKDILKKVDDLIDSRDSPKFDQSTNESFLKIVSVCSMAEEPKRIQPITKPLRVEVDLDESIEDQRNVPKITITKQRASPKIRIKPILKPDEKSSPSDNTPRVIIKPIKQDPLKITITKQSDDSHSILKIYKPEEHEETVPKLTIKPIPKPDEMQHSPRTMKIIKQSDIGPNITVKPIMSCEVVPGDTHSPKSRKTEENYPKVTIKPILRPDDAQKSQPLSPRQTLKMKAFESSGITMEPILTSPNSETQINPLKIKTMSKPEESLSPKLTIKPIAKTCEIVQSEDGTSNPLKLTIKPLKDDAHQSPKITIKPVLKPEEPPPQDEDKPERIILKIQKTNLPSPKERTSIHVKDKERLEPGETNEKLGKIKLKLMKEAGHAQIIPSQIVEDNQLKRTLLSVGESSIPEKRPRQELGPEILHTSDISINIVEPNQPTYPKTVSEEVTIMKIDQPMEKPSTNILSRALTTPQQPSESKFKEMLLQIQQKRDLTCTPQAIQDQSSDSDDVKIIGIIPGDKPVNKAPLPVNEESSSQDVIIISETIITNPFHDLQFIKTSDINTSTPNATTITPDVTVTPIIPEVVVPTPKKRGRPRKNPLEVKPEIKGEDCIEIETRPKRTCRAPVGRAPYVVTERKPRGRGGGRGRGRGARGGSSPKPGKETKSPRGRKSLKAQFSRLYAEPDEKDTVTVIERLNQSVGDVTNTENIDKNLMKEPKHTGQISKVPTPIKDRKEIDPVPVFEEETRMSADNNNSRAQTPARQFVVPLPSEGPEESQSSVQSSATTESGKNKKGRLEVIDYDVHVTVVDQIAEYSWGGGGPYMLQEQIAQYLGVKSFKRKYPGLSRRPVEMQERDFIREKNLVSEALCDMGLTAVPSSEILDIMYTDFQDKYEEYRKFMRDKQSKEISNKQKAISLATSQEKNKIDFKERAIKSAANWNSNFNKARRETRKCCVDLQTFTINYPTGQTQPKVPYKEPVGSYPIALVPGQFTDYYKSYNPAELNYLPLNTVRYGPLLPNLLCTDSGMSDGSVSDSDSSSGSDSDSSDDSMSTIDDAPSSKANTPIPTSAPGTPKSMARAN